MGSGKYSSPPTHGGYGFRGVSVRGVLSADLGSFLFLFFFFEREIPSGTEKSSASGVGMGGGGGARATGDNRGTMGRSTERRRARGRITSLCGNRFQEKVYLRHNGTESAKGAEMETVSTITTEELRQARMFYLRSPDGQWDDVAVWAIEQAIRARGERVGEGE